MYYAIGTAACFLCT